MEKQMREDKARQGAAGGTSSLWEKMQQLSQGPVVPKAGDEKINRHSEFAAE